jgi:hypothetical protein
MGWPVDGTVNFAGRFFLRQKVHFFYFLNFLELTGYNRLFFLKFILKLFISVKARVYWLSGINYATEFDRRT